MKKLHARMVLDICAGLGYGATLSPRFPESRGELLSERLELERLPQERQGGGTQAIDGFQLELEARR